MLLIIRARDEATRSLRAVGGSFGRLGRQMAQAQEQINKNDQRANQLTKEAQKAHKEVEQQVRKNIDARRAESKQYAQKQQEFIRGQKTRINSIKAERQAFTNITRDAIQERQNEMKEIRRAGKMSLEQIRALSTAERKQVLERQKGGQARIKELDKLNDLDRRAITQNKVATDAQVRAHNQAVKRADDRIRVEARQGARYIDQQKRQQAAHAQTTQQKIASYQAEQKQLNDLQRMEMARLQRVQMLSQRLMGAGQAALMLGSVVAATGAIIVSRFKGSVQAAREFEKGVALAFTQVEGGVATMADIREGIFKIASDIPVPFQELEGTFYDIFSSMQVNMEEAQELAVAFSRSAVAGQVDIQSAAKSSIAIMNAFGYEMKDLNRIENVQFELVRKGVGSYADFSNNIGKVIPAANRAGQEIESMSGMLAFLTRNGLSAAMASTSAARALEAFARPVSVRRLEELGVTVRDAKGEFNQIDVIMRSLSDTLQDMTKPERAEALTRIFMSGGGTIQARRFIDVAVSEHGVEQLEKFINFMREAADADYLTSLGFEPMAATADAAFTMMANASQMLKIEIGDALIPVIVDLLGHVQDGIEWFRNLDPELKQNIIRFTALAGVIATAAGTLLTFGGLLAIALGALVQATASVKIAVGIFGGFFSLLAMAPAIIYLIIKHWETLSGIFEHSTGYIIAASVALAVFMAMKSGTHIAVFVLDLIKHIKTFTVSTYTSVTAVGALRIALMALQVTGILAVVAAVGYLIQWFVDARREANEFADAVVADHDTTNLRGLEDALEAVEKAYGETGAAAAKSTLQGNQFANMMFGSAGRGAIKMILTNRALGESHEDLSESLDMVEQNVENLVTAYETFGYTAQQVRAAAGDLGIDLSVRISEDEMQRIMRVIAAHEAGGAAAAQQQIAIEGLGDETESLVDQLDNLSTALSRTMDQHFGATNAAFDFEDAIVTLTDAVAGNGNSLDTLTPAGRDSHRAFQDMAQAAIDLAEHTYSVTDSQEEATAALLKGRDAIIKVAKEAGLGVDEIRPFIDLLEDADQTFDMNIEFRNNGAETERSIHDVNMALRGIPVATRSAWDGLELLMQGGNDFGELLDELTNQKLPGTENAIRAVDEAITGLMSHFFGWREAQASINAFFDELEDKAINAGAGIDINSEAGRHNLTVLKELAGHVTNLNKEVADNPNATAEMIRAAEDARKKFLEFASDIGVADDDLMELAKHMDEFPELISPRAEIRNVDRVLSDIERMRGALANLDAGLMQRFQVDFGIRPGNRPGMHGGSVVTPLAQGGILTNTEVHNPQIARSTSAMRLWAEPETAGETYLPWALSKRARSVHYLRKTANAWGYDVVPYAEGGIHDFIAHFKGNAEFQPFPKVGGGYQALIDYIRSTGTPHRVTSTVRPGAMTASGNMSRHARGLAVDFADPAGPRPRGSPAMQRIFDTFMRISSRLNELIYTPAGYSIKNGRRVPAYARASHYNHVHAALAKGGIVTKPIFAEMGEAGPEAVIPLSRMGSNPDIIGLFQQLLNIGGGAADVGNMAPVTGFIEASKAAEEAHVAMIRAKNELKAAKEEHRDLVRSWTDANRLVKEIGNELHKNTTQGKIDLIQSQQAVANAKEQLKYIKEMGPLEKELAILKADQNVEAQKQLLADMKKPPPITPAQELSIIRAEKEVEELRKRLEEAQGTAPVDSAALEDARAQFIAAQFEVERVNDMMAAGGTGSEVQDLLLQFGAQKQLADAKKKLEEEEQSLNDVREDSREIELQLIIAEENLKDMREQQKYTTAQIREQEIALQMAIYESNKARRDQKTQAQDVQLAELQLMQAQQSHQDVIAAGNELSAEAQAARDALTEVTDKLAAADDRVAAAEKGVTDAHWANLAAQASLITSMQELNAAGPKTIATFNAIAQAAGWSASQIGSVNQQVAAVHAANPVVAAAKATGAQVFKSGPDFFLRTPTKGWFHASGGGQIDGIKRLFGPATTVPRNHIGPIQGSVASLFGGGGGIEKVLAGQQPLPALARGGIVRRRPGGVLAQIAEGRHDEAVIPLTPALRNNQSSKPEISINYREGSIIVNVEGTASDAEEIKQALLEGLLESQEEAISNIGSM